MNQHQHTMKKLNLIEKFENNTLTLDDLKTLEAAAYAEGYKQGYEDKVFEIYGI